MRARAGGSDTEVACGGGPANAGRALDARVRGAFPLILRHCWGQCRARVRQVRQEQVYFGRARLLLWWQARALGHALDPLATGQRLTASAQRDQTRHGADLV